MICVTDTSNGIIYVEEFFNLKVSQTGISDYNYIRNSLCNPEITSPACVDSEISGRRICYVKMLALDLFFLQNTSPSYLTISGSVFVTRDGRGVSDNLGNDVHGVSQSTTRRVQANGDEEESGNFKITVSLGSTDASVAQTSGAVSAQTSGVAAVSLVSLAVGAAFMT